MEGVLVGVGKTSMKTSSYENLCNVGLVSAWPESMANRRVRRSSVMMTSPIHGKCNRGKVASDANQLPAVSPKLLPLDEAAEDKCLPAVAAQLEDTASGAAMPVVKDTLEKRAAAAER